ncbi:MAG TPA: hypothetical protein VGJ14_15020 [Sporichthyaceae bacterium]|jgi:hypothetical protein
MSAAGPSLDEIADELYGLPLADFTAARTGYEKQARQAGDKELAGRIKALAKPNVVAWLANQLARAHADELAPLIELGAGMREATRALAGDELRALAKQRDEVVRALMSQARALAKQAGQAVSDSTAGGLADTLHAALVDQHAAEALLAGRLVEGLFRSGFGDVEAAPPNRSPAKVARLDDVRLRRAEQDLVEAARALAEAGSVRDDAQSVAADADAAAQAAGRRVEELRGELDDARTAAAEAERARKDSAAAVREADKAVRAAQRRQADAQAERDRIAGVDG